MTRDDAAAASTSTMDTPPNDPSTNLQQQQQPKAKNPRRLRGNPQGGGAPIPVGLDHPKTLKADLACFGFSTKQVKAILARRPAFEVDATAQRPQGHKVIEAEQAAERERKEEKRARKLKGVKYKSLSLVEGSSVSSSPFLLIFDSTLTLNPANATDSANRLGPPRPPPTRLHRSRPLRHRRRALPGSLRAVRPVRHGQCAGPRVQRGQREREDPVDAKSAPGESGAVYGGWAEGGGESGERDPGECG